MRVLPENTLACVPNANKCMAVQMHAVWAGGQDAVAAGLAGGQQLPLAEVVSSLLEWRPLHKHIRFLAQPCLPGHLAISVNLQPAM